MEQRARDENVATDSHVHHTALEWIPVNYWQYLHSCILCTDIKVYESTELQPYKLYMITLISC